MSVGIAVQALSFAIACFYTLTSSGLNKLDFGLTMSIVGAYGAMMFASSYVEEEQQFWYWLGAGWLFFIGARTYHHISGVVGSSSIRYSIATWTLAICHRIIQRWNQTGQKHAGAPDIVTSVLNIHPFYMWCLIGFSYLFVTLRASICLGSSLNIPSLVAIPLILTATVPSLLLKVGFTAADAPELFFWLQGEDVLQLQELPLLLLARIVFTSLFVLFLAILTFKSNSAKSGSAVLTTTHALFTILVMTQSRAVNTPVFLLSLLQFIALQQLELSAAQASVTCLVLGQVAFYALGNSNAMSSIDLSNAYNGVSGYNIVAVGVLLFIGNWAGPLSWGIGALALIAQSLDAKPKDTGDKKGKAQEPDKSPFLSHASVFTVFVAGSTLAVMAACTMMRTHLFIWTVFSPKYLFTMAWSLGFHFLFTMGIGRGLWSLAGI
jgi:ethanolamine phosphate transferase 2 subunit G